MQGMPVTKLAIFLYFKLAGLGLFILCYRVITIFAFLA